MNMDTPKRYLHISIANQNLMLIEQDEVAVTYPVSTAKNGAGESMGSECTPTGWHKIRVKIGEDQPLHTVFVGRRPTGEVYTPALAAKEPHRDWVLSRILWLGGVESGKNRYGSVDSTWRYIYIHGCPDALMQGKPESHGCIRMNNADVVALFARVPSGLPVLID